MDYLGMYLFGFLMGCIAFSNYNELNEEVIDCVVERQEMTTEDIMKLCK